MAKGEAFERTRIGALVIAFIRGELIEEKMESVVVETNGVGYELHCSQNTLDDLFGKAEVRVWVYTHVREDALVLFGFSTKLEKQIFESLLKVNGVGPKLAIKVLSGAPIQKVAEMIEAADVKGLTQLPKVGKKTAEQIVLTLKGKLKMEPVGGSVQRTPVREQIQSALINLGFKNTDVEKTLDGMSVDVDFETGVRESLALLSGGK